MQARLKHTKFPIRTESPSTLLPQSKVGASVFEYSLNHPVLAGGEVVFGRVDERNAEVKHQVDEQRSGVLGQEHLGGGRGCHCVLLCMDQYLYVCVCVLP